MSIKIFFCYAREDQPLLFKLQTQLKPLQRQGIIDAWGDWDISAGSDWKQEISRQLNTSKIILLMISPDFFASDYCYSVEMRQALARHERREAYVIPVILRPVHWEDELFGKLQALPKNGKPVTSRDWHNVDEALFSVAEGIRALVKKMSNAEEEALPSVVKVIPKDVTSHLNSNARYYVYEDDPTSTAKIHIASCRYCNNGHGIKATRLNDNRWHGPFDTLQEADTVARETGKRNVGRCTICRPN